MNRLYIVIVLMIFTINGVAQISADTLSVDSLKTEKKIREKRPAHMPHLFWGFKAGAGMLGWTFENEQITLENDLAFTGGIYFELQTFKWMSVELGGNYTMLKGKASLADYSASINAVDDEGDSYVHTIYANYADEDMKASLVEVPVAIRLLWNPGGWHFYLKPGVAYTMAVSNSYSQSLKVSISGYYADGNVDFTDLAQHGYVSNKYAESTGELAVKNSVNPFIGAGIVFPGRRGNFFVEGRYYPGSIDFSNGSGNGQLFEGPMDNQSISGYNFESVTEEAGKISLQGFIVEMGFRF